MFGDLQVQRRTQYEQLWNAQNELIEGCKKAGGRMSQAQQDEYDSRERDMNQLQRAIKSGDGGQGDGLKAPRLLSPEDEKRQKAFDAYLRSGIPTPELRTTYDAGLNEAGFQDSGTAGGFTVPQGFWDQLIVAMKDYSSYADFYRQVQTETGNPMDFPTNDPTGNVGAIIGEGVVDDFLDETFGQGVFNAWTYTSKLILVSVELARDSAFDIGQLVAARIAERIGRAESAHSASGTGSGQPLGLITSLAAKGLNSGSGASGGYIDLGTATSTNVVGGSTVDELAGQVLSPVTLALMQQSINSSYWRNAAWYFNPVQFVAQQNLADGYGRPLYPSLQDANPTLLGKPVRVVAAGPAMAASTVGGPVYGDLEQAMARRTVGTAEVLVMRERYMDARQYGYFGFLRRDHRSLDLRAAVTVKPSSS